MQKEPFKIPTVCESWKDRNCAFEEDVRFRHMHRMLAVAKPIPNTGDRFFLTKEFTIIDKKRLKYVYGHLARDGRVVYFIINEEGNRVSMTKKEIVKLLGVEHAYNDKTR